MNQMKFPSCHQETIPSAAPALSPPAEPSPPPPVVGQGPGVVEDSAGLWKINKDALKMLGGSII